jgi:hypothetical protein
MMTATEWWTITSPVHLVAQVRMRSHTISRYVTNAQPDSCLYLDSGLMGACAAGTTTCVNGATQCQQTVAATTETCNGTVPPLRVCLLFMLYSQGLMTTATALSTTMSTRRQARARQAAPLCSARAAGSTANRAQPSAARPTPTAGRVLATQTSSVPFRASERPEQLLHRTVR